jgi:ketosteroid isomerase-like protein
MPDRRIARTTHLRVLANAFVVTLIFTTASFSSVQAQTTPTSAERKELLEVRQLVWESYFRNDQVKLKELIGEDFITINPGEQHWQNHNEFVAGAKAFADHQGKLVSLSFPRTEIQDFGDVAVLYSLVQITMESQGKQDSLSCRSTEVFQRRGGRWVNTGAHVDSGQ